MKDKNLMIWVLIIAASILSYMAYSKHQIDEGYNPEQEWSNSHFQDKEMSSHFIELHKEDLKKFRFYGSGIFPEHNGYMKTIYKEIVPFSCGETAMSIDRGRLSFLKKDLVLKSKEYLFLEAQRCIKLILKDIDSKVKQQTENELKFQEAMKTEFDPSKIH